MLRRLQEEGEDKTTHEKIHSCDQVWASVQFSSLLPTKVQGTCHLFLGDSGRLSKQMQIFILKILQKVAEFQVQYLGTILLEFEERVFIF